VTKPDLILAGGGLANCLIAWRLALDHPGLRVLLLEAGGRLGGNHTWSFHRSDLTPSQNAWIGPMVAHEWPRHEVRFPGLNRRLDGAYRSATSQGLHDHLTRGGLVDVRYGARIRQLTPTTVTLDDGSQLQAGAVIDGLGQRDNPHLVLGYQKFLGLELELTREHGLNGPVIMDATVSQADGYRFVYVLPFTPTRVLVEDTRYSDGPALDTDTLRQAVLDYVRDRDWTVSHELRREQGILPILLAADLDAFWCAPRTFTHNAGEPLQPLQPDRPDRPEQPVQPGQQGGLAAHAGGMARSGLAAGLFHPTTGYSLPFAVGLAEAIAANGDFSPEGLHDLTRSHVESHWRRTGFFRLLNRMLFRAGRPGQRYLVLQRFYGLSEGLIARFYGARLRGTDKLRLLAGKPPVPVLPALACLSERALYRRESRAGTRHGMLAKTLAIPWASVLAAAKGKP